MPRLPAKQREAEKIATPLENGGFAASSNDVPARIAWDHHATSLLQTLPGDKRKRKQLIEKMIGALDKRREEFRREKKTGAGSASEGIMFYQHVLHLNNTWKGASDGSTNVNGKRQLDSTTSPSTPGDVLLPPSKKRRGRPRKNAKPESPVPETTETTKYKVDENEDEDRYILQSSSSLTSEAKEFLNQHDDYCTVCSDGGELLCCATCCLSFHLQCLRPVLKALPDSDDWSCPYCESKGVTGLKKESRPRKRAANGVREMRRLQKSKAAENEKGEKSEDHAPKKRGPGRPRKIKPTTPESKGGNEDGVKDNHQPMVKKRGPGRPRKIRHPSPESNIGNEDEKKDSEQPIVKKRGPGRPRKVRPPSPESTVSTKNDGGVEAAEQQLSDSTIPAIGNSPGGSLLIGGANGTNSRTMKEVFDHLSPLDFGQPRSRRQRNKPMMYNPQSCSATEWQSDGKTEWRYLSTEDDTEKKRKHVDESDSDYNNEEDKSSSVFTKEDIPLTLLKKFNALKGKSNRTSQFSCRYCMDDDSIPLCCFCACRICFSKHGKEDTILCDLCDSEYHMSCLSPPLQEVPESDWFCPICVEQINEAKEIEDTKTTDSRSARKIRDKALVDVKKEKSEAKMKAEGRAAAAAKQPRTSTGRFAPAPNKNQLRTEAGRFTSKLPDASDTNTSSSIEEDPSPPVKKRGRGRPPKSKNKKTLLNKSSPKPTLAPGEKKRGPGRPPKSKNKNTLEMVASRVLSSRTRRAAAAAAEAAASKTDSPKPPAQKVEKEVQSNDTAPAEPVKRSRSGRVVKRNTHYDDIGEGQQHLKSHMRAAFESGKLPQTSFSPMQEAASMKNTYGMSKEDIQMASVAASDAMKGILEKEPDQLKLTQSTKASLLQPNTSNEAPPTSTPSRNRSASYSRSPRRKPGARECMQMSRRFGDDIIPQQYVDVLMDYCSRGKVEHLIRMRERLDEHSRFLEIQLAGLEMMIQQHNGVEPGR